MSPLEARLKSETVRQRRTDYKKVTAVVLTHNRATQVLKRCEELTSQTRPPDEIVVVDNGSTDGSADRIAAQFSTVVIHRLVENTGPAGGFAAGFTLAIERGCDYVWAIDDDVVISPDCLEHLLAEAASGPPRVVFPTRLPLGRKHGVAWHAILVPAEIVRAVGVPRADFFWCVEDTEYFAYRIPKAGFGRAISSKARVVHVAERPRRGWPGWKFYYQTRNPVHYRLYIKRDLWKVFMIVVHHFGRLLVVLVREERPLAKAAMILRGFRDGFRGVLGKTVDPKA